MVEMAMEVEVVATVEPIKVEPTTVEPIKVEPTTVEPITVEPTTVGPTTEVLKDTKGPNRAVLMLQLANHQKVLQSVNQMTRVQLLRSQRKKRRLRHESKQLMISY